MLCIAVLVGLWLLLIGVPAGAADDDPLRLLELLKTQRPLPEYQDLLPALEMPDARVRWLTCRDLGLRGLPEAVPHLVRRLADRNLEVRRLAREALLRLGQAQPRPFDMLIEASLTGLDPESVLTARAVRDEGRGRLAEARRQYVRVFQADPRRLWAAVWGYDTGRMLREIRAPLKKEVETVTQALRQSEAAPRMTYPESVLRQAYALSVLSSTLSRLTGNAVFEALSRGRTQAARDLRRDLAETLSGAGELETTARRIEDKLVEHVRDFTPSDLDPALDQSAGLIRVRASAARELGRFRTQAVERGLIEALNRDPGPSVRASAAESLGRIASDNAIQALLEAFERDESIRVRRTALTWLGARPDRRARSVIYEAVSRDEYKEAAILAIGLRGKPDDLEFLRRASKDPTFYTRQDKGLGLAGRDTETIRLAIAQALEIAAQRAESPLNGRLREEAARIRAEASRGRPPE
ncbi:MAG: HEAT repeat domain-containing protein [Proteobacteria bacterium]|nr:HEAT repeat domain-containing protein [Pseudomonadota bacterium]